MKKKEQERTCMCGWLVEEEEKPAVDDADADENKSRFSCFGWVGWLVNLTYSLVVYSHQCSQDEPGACAQHMARLLAHAVIAAFALYSSSHHALLLILHIWISKTISFLVLKPFNRKRVWKKHFKSVEENPSGGETRRQTEKFFS